MAAEGTESLNPDGSDFKRALEELKELGHEYRYREQLMIQEFSLIMVAIAGLLNVLLRDPPPAAWAAVLLQVLGAAVLILITLHLRNINQDRWHISDRKAIISDLLGFARTNQNIGGRFRFKVPLNIVRLTAVIATLWTLWALARIAMEAPTLIALTRSCLAR